MFKANTETVARPCPKRFIYIVSESSRHLGELGAIASPISQVKKLRCRKAEQLTLSHIADSWESQDVNPMTPESIAYSHPSNGGKPSRNLFLIQNPIITSKSQVQSHQSLPSLFCVSFDSCSPRSQGLPAFQAAPKISDRPGRAVWAGSKHRVKS